MFRFTRTATVKAGGALAVAMGHGMEVAGYLNGKQGLGMRFGPQLFGSYNVQWQFDAPSLATIEEVWSSVMQDADYWELVEKGKDLWVEGSIQDTLCQFLG